MKVLAVVMLALLLGACERPANKPATAPAGAGVAQKQAIQVSNTMAMPMSVVAVVGGQTQALGTVPPKGEGSFSVRAAPGTDYQIIGSDSTDQHKVQAVLMGASRGVLHFVIR